jgi:predicted TPR repeat methyltransferase
MENLRQATIDTYNQSANALADYFRGIGPRVKDIDLAFELAGHPKEARVLEIGCGDGRDAKDIINKASWYHGLDISSELINLAKAHVPNASFEVADAVNYIFPKNLDIVFAFASLLHLSKEEVKQVLNDVHQSLKTDGIFFISLKEKPKYTYEIKEDKFGKRLFYFYNPGIIRTLAGNGYKVVSTSRKQLGHTDWFEIALQKISLHSF